MAPPDPASSGYERRFEIRGGLDAAREAQDELLAALERLDFDQTCRFAVRLALEEALSNAVKHGNRGDAAKCVVLSCAADSETIRIVVEDEGEGFDPGAVPDPTQSENLEIPSGRGIVLMRSFMTELAYDPPGNRLRMTFERPRD